MWLVSQKGRGGRRKVDRFLADKSWSSTTRTRRYPSTSTGGVPRRVSGLCAKNQRKISQAVSVLA